MAGDLAAQATTKSGEENVTNPFPRACDVDSYAVMAPPPITDPQSVKLEPEPPGITDSRRRARDVPEAPLKAPGQNPGGGSSYPALRRVMVDRG